MSAAISTIQAEIDACPLHRRHTGPLLHYTRNSRGFYGMYAPPCNGCVIGAREMLEFEVCGNVEDAVRRVRECIDDHAATAADLRTELDRLKAERYDLLRLDDDSDMCLNALDAANEAIADATTALEIMAAAAMIPKCSNCGSTSAFVHPMFGMVCAPCVRESS